MELTPVDSEAVSAVGWENGVLYWRYRSGSKIYEQAGVTQATYEALLSAPSIGKAIAQIKRQNPAK